MPPFLPPARRPVAVLLAVAAVAAGACVPHARPLPGVEAPTRLPAAQLPPVRRQVLFRWSYEDPDLGGSGEGVARIAPPDSVRLDLFIGSMGGGHAFLIGDTVVAPGGDALRRFLPPPPLLWAALGRLAVPPAADTVARRDGEVLRADIGNDPTWRASFIDGELVRLERIQGGRLVEWVDRTAPARVRYRNESARRSLALTITRTDTVPDFDASIWLR